MLLLELIWKLFSLGVISGDSLVLRGRPGPQGQLPKERWAPRTQLVFATLTDPLRILHLADASSPRLGNASREDEVGDRCFHGVCLTNRWFSASPGRSKHASSYAR